MPEEAYKQCSKCEEVKPEIEFYRQSASPDGLQRWCKQCSIASRKTWGRANPRQRQQHKQHGHERNPDQARAWWAVRNALATGRITKPNRCRDCGGEFEKHLIHGHHPNYSKPLEVEWLCGPCHAERHRKLQPACGTTAP